MQYSCKKKTPSGTMRLQPANPAAKIIRMGVKRKLAIPIHLNPGHHIPHAQIQGEKRAKERKLGRIGIPITKGLYEKERSVPGCCLSNSVWLFSFF